MYTKAAAGFRFIDLGILALVLVHLVAVACSRKPIVRFPRVLILPGIRLPAVHRHRHRVRPRCTEERNFFFDWRALALGAGLYFVWAFWIRTPAMSRARSGFLQLIWRCASRFCSRCI